MNYLSLFLKYIRPIVIISAVVAIILLLYFKGSSLISYFQNVIKIKKDESNAENMPSDSDLNNKEYDLPHDYAAGFAKQLFDAMKDIGTDHQTILSVLNHLEKGNLQNVVRVFNAFGTPKYFLTGEAALFGEPQNLWYWLKSELNTTSEEKKILARWQVLLHRAKMI